MDEQRPDTTSASSETTASARVPVSPVRTTRFGHYLVVAKLGQGGMSEVHLAIAEGPSGFKKLVALKRLFPHLADDRSAVEMFLDEARLASRFSHANIVQTFEVGVEHGQHFMAMEYLAGQPFHRIVQRAARVGGRVAAPLTARIVADALHGLHHAHEATDYDGTPLGVVHRDVSPHNVFVTYEGVAKLLDFGIAKAATQESVTRAGMVKGKFAYVAPEQARGKPLDRRADLWSVGVVLWEALAGRRLFKGETEAGTLEQSLSMPVPDLRDVTDDVPAELAVLVGRALSRDPELRPATALEMREELERWMALSGHGEGRAAVRAHMQAEFGSLETEQRVLVKRCVEQAAGAAARARDAEPTRPTGRATAAPPSAPDRRPALQVAVVVVAAAVAAVLALVWPKAEPTLDGEPATVAAPAHHASAEEDAGDEDDSAATELRPDDVPPRLVEGSRPPAPVLGGFAPTITTRVDIGRDGRVRNATIFAPRAELGAYEHAALRAVRGYRFDPAKRDGEPVAVFANWPVRFVPIDDRPLRVRVKGSDTIGGALGPDLAQAFMMGHPEVAVIVDSLGSSTAFAGLFDGTADLGASSRSVNAAELDEASRLGVALREFVIAYDGIAVVVHADNPVRALRMDELRGIYDGTIRSWDEVGGEAVSIRPLGRPGYSGTHAFFRDAVLGAAPDGSPPRFGGGVDAVEHSDALVRRVAADPRAIGYVGVGWVSDGLAIRALALAPEQADPVTPSLESIRAGRYPIARPLLLYSAGPPKGPAKELLRFVFSPEGRAIVSEHGFSPADAVVQLDDTKSEEPDEAGQRTVERFYFSRGGTRMDDESAARLATLGERVVDRRGVDVVVVGHADSEGDRSINRNLATARARAVVARLEAAGVPAARIESRSAAADEPLATNETATGRQVNRRVDVFLVPR